MVFTIPLPLLRLFLYMYDLLVAERRTELGARTNGGGKNPHIIVPEGGKNLIARCPFCSKDGKFGVYIGKKTSARNLLWRTASRAVVRRPPWRGCSKALAG